MQKYVQVANSTELKADTKIVKNNNLVIGIKTLLNIAFITL